MPPERMLNLGPVSRRWLERVGIRDLETLKTVGAVEAWHRVHETGVNPTLNLLYGLEGAIQGVRWDELDEQDRARLRASIQQDFA